MIDKLFDEAKLEFLKVLGIVKEDGQLIKKETGDPFIPIPTGKNDKGEYVLKSRNETLIFRDNYIKHTDTKVLKSLTVKLNGETGIAEGYVISAKPDYENVDSHYDVEIDALFNKYFMSTCIKHYRNKWNTNSSADIGCSLSSIDCSSNIQGLRIPPSTVDLSLENYLEKYRYYLNCFATVDFGTFFYDAISFISYLYEKMSKNPIIYKSRFRGSFDKIAAENDKHFKLDVIHAYENRNSEGAVSLEEAVGRAIDALDEKEVKLNELREQYNEYVKTFEKSEEQNNDLHHTGNKI